jgi:hypothetical protein
MRIQIASVVLQTQKICIPCRGFGLVYDFGWMHWLWTQKSIKKRIVWSKSFWSESFRSITGHILVPDCFNRVIEKRATRWSLDFVDFFCRHTKRHTTARCLPDPNPVYRAGIWLWFTMLGWMHDDKVDKKKRIVWSKRFDRPNSSIDYYYISTRLFQQGTGKRATRAEITGFCGLLCRTRKVYK